MISITSNYSHPRCDINFRRFCQDIDSLLASCSFYSYLKILFSRIIICNMSNLLFIFESFPRKAKSNFHASKIHGMNITQESAVNFCLHPSTHLPYTVRLICRKRKHFNYCLHQQTQLDFSFSLETILVAQFYDIQILSSFHLRKSHVKWFQR